MTTPAVLTDAPAVPPANPQPPTQPPPVPAPGPGPVVPPAPASATETNGDTSATPSEVPDWAKDPTKAYAEVQAARDDAAKARQRNEDALAAAVEAATQKATREATEALTTQFGQALGLVPKDGEAPADPAQLEQQYKDQVAKEQRETRRVQVELAVYRNATAAGADGDALLDSASFLASLEKVDPTDSEAVQEAIKAAVEKNKRLAAVTETPATPPTPGASGAEFTGGSRDQRNIDQLIAEAVAAGNNREAIHLKRQKAAQTA